MKSPVRLLSILVATMLAVPAVAGEIVKCVDTSGHVTLTDQACEAGNTRVRLASDSDDVAPQHHTVAPASLRAVWKRPPAVGGAAAGYAGNGGGASLAPVRLSLDVATLKAAHRSMLMQDAKPRLANLD